MATDVSSWPVIQSPMNGSETPTTSSATPTLTGKPTANTFSCGTTLETIPKAMSVIDDRQHHRRRDLDRADEHATRTPLCGRIEHQRL